jgi:hypothetical protein
MSNLKVNSLSLTSIREKRLNQNKITLNPEQIELKSILISWTNYNKYGYFGVLGAGGTGKTTVICEALKDYKGSVVYLGATNKVIGVLKKGLENNNIKNPTIKTIDSFLGFKITKDFENKSQISFRLPSPKNTPSLLVIDEVSMITKQKFEQLKILEKYCKIILIGDNMQLPPIEDINENEIRDVKGFKVSTIFTKINENNSFTLTIQNRQNIDSKMGQLVADFRTHMDKFINPKLMATKKNNNIDVFFYKTNDKELKEIIKNENPVAVCFKNLTVLSLNWLIGSTKSMKKDYRLNEINVGDSLMFDQFYVDKNKTTFYTSNIVEVLKITTDIEELFFIKEKIIKKIIYSELEVLSDDNETKIIRYISGGLYGVNGGGVSSSVSGQRTTYKRHILENKNVFENKKYLADLNTRFSDYQNSFAKLKRPYAITCHKAQGSTYNNVIIPVYDFYALNHKDANQLLYVAMSRAKSKIIFIDKSENFDNTSKRHSFTEYEKNAICSTFDYKCAKCSIDLVERDYNIDHILPIANGGKNSIENLQPLCVKCHKRKTAFEVYNSKTY